MAKNTNKIDLKGQHGKVFSSFSALGKALHITQPDAPTPKEKKCRKCGAVMTQIPGTNVALCPGMVKDKDGNEKPCGNRAFATVRSHKASIYKDFQTTPIGQPLPAIQTQV